MSDDGSPEFYRAVSDDDDDGPEFYLATKRIEQGRLVEEECWIGLCNQCRWYTAGNIDLQGIVDAMHNHRLVHHSPVGEPT